MNRSATQSGLSFTSFLLGAFCIVMLCVIALKMIPVYMQNSEINRILVAIANDPDMQGASASEMRASFSKRAAIDNVSVVDPKEIMIDKSSGKPFLTVNYSVKIPLVANVSLYLEFNSASQ